MTASLNPKFPQATTGPRTCTRWFRHRPLLRRNPAQPTSGKTKLVEPARERQRTAESKPPGSQKADPTTGPRTCTRWFRHGPLLRRSPAQPTSGGNVAARLNRLQEGDIATRLNQLQEKQSWLSQHVSASERLSRNHPAAKKQIRPQAPGHAQDGFDTGRSFVAARLNQLREGNVAGRLNRLRENC